MFLTAAPGCAGPSSPAESSQALAICQAEQGWSYPSSSLPDSLVLDVVPNSSVYVPGHANAFSMGSIAAMSTAPASIERWFYQGDFLPSDTVNASGTALRTWFWIARKYHLSGVFLWAANFWENPCAGVALGTRLPTGSGMAARPPGWRRNGRRRSQLR